MRPAAAPLLLTATAECPAAEDFGAAGEEPPPKPAMTPMLLLLLVAEAAVRFAAGAAAEAWGVMLPRPPRAAAGEKAPPRTAADEKAPVAEAAEADGALGLGATEPVEPGRIPERAAGATGRDPIELELRRDGSTGSLRGEDAADTLVAEEVLPVRAPKELELRRYVSMGLLRGEVANTLVFEAILSGETGTGDSSECKP